MADKVELGSAYITIIPTTKGMVTTIDSELKKAGTKGGKACGEAVTDGITDAANSGDIENAGDTIGSKLSGGIGKVVSAAAVTAVATAIASVTKAAVEAYADYEQLVGGVDTLFKEASDNLQAYADEAYKTAGMSANDYMETATSFSASLINSLGGDTEKAAEYANKAILQMSDNANKMGTDISSIQNAYQGFAKSNYAMLDNLKIGYSGTKEGMEQLLADASAISGVTYDISSYADIVDAIGIIQDKMGITGTTAAEAAETITGSISSTQAAWENLLVAFAQGDTATQKAMDNVVASATDVLSNVVPIIENVVNSILGELPDIVDKIFDKLVEYLPKLVSIVGNLAVKLVQAIPALVKTLVAQLPTIINELIDSLTEFVPAFIDAGVQLFMALIEDLPTIVKNIVEAIPKIIDAICEYFKSPEAILQMIEAGLQMGAALVEGIVNAVGELIKGLGNTIVSLFSGIFNFWAEEPTVTQSVSVAPVQLETMSFNTDSIKTGTTIQNVNITAQSGDELDYLITQATAAAASY